jgi:hypothetical protein
MVAAGYVVYLTAQQAGGDVRIDSDDIGGSGHEHQRTGSGRLGIAETKDRPTKFAKIVLTDHRGRHVLPDLRKANYSVWARGYGLVDGPMTHSMPGKTVNLTAAVAPNARAPADIIRRAFGIPC